MYETLMLMEFPNLAPLIVTLIGIFWLYASKDGSDAPQVDQLDLAVLLFPCQPKSMENRKASTFRIARGNFIISISP